MQRLQTCFPPRTDDDNADPQLPTRAPQLSVHLLLEGIHLGQTKLIEEKWTGVADILLRRGQQASRQQTLPLRRLRTCGDGGEEQYTIKSEDTILASSLHILFSCVVS